MADKTLKQICEEHEGKVSDKWSVYIDEYDRILSPYRKKHVRLLEIGIQNGGSLEIWSKYFPRAQNLVGCDINPDCSSLRYENPCIAVVPGDANSDETQAAILRHSPAFDVILDDGSHRSSDIVKSFTRYFPILADGGVFVAEDLHCSYWETYEGGLFDPYSSIAFFKRLADVISHEHWGVDKSRAEILQGIFSKYGAHMEEEVLERVHSVEFINSMCIVRKASPESNRLGARIIAGSEETIQSSNVLAVRSMPPLSAALVADCADQSGNVWAARSVPPDEELLPRLNELSDSKVQVNSLNQIVSDQNEEIAKLKDELSERGGQIARLTQTVSDREERIARLKEIVAERDLQVAGLNQIIWAYQNSLSWLVTKPLRYFTARRYVRPFVSYLRRLKTELPRQASRLLKGEPRDSAKLMPESFRFFMDQTQAAFVEIVRDLTAISGWAVDLDSRSASKVRVVVGRTVHETRSLQRDDVKQAMAHLGEIPRETGFSVAIKLPIGLHRVRIEALRSDGQWMPFHWALLFRRPQLGSSQPILNGSLRFCIDKPIEGFINIFKSSIVIAGWAVDLETQSAAKTRVIVGNKNHPTHTKMRVDVQRAFAPQYALPPDTGFAHILTLPFGLHRMRVEVEESSGNWIPAYRTLLLCTPQIFSVGRKEGITYAAWMRFQQKRLAAEIPDIARHIELMIEKPAFTVVVDTRSGSIGLAATIESIRNQLYSNWDVRILANPDARPPSIPGGARILADTSLSNIHGDFIVLMESGQRLVANALYEFASAVNQYPDIDLVYGDEDRCNASGKKCGPFHKPGWSPDYLETFNYIGFTACFRTSVARGCFDRAHAYDFVLRFTERTTKVLHIEKILGHGIDRRGTGTTSAAGDIEALSGRLLRTGRRGSVSEHTIHGGCYDIRLHLARTPLVSIVIPTAGKTVQIGERQIDLLDNVINQIRDRSTYENLEIIVIDNGDLSCSQLEMLARTGCRRITYTEPVFNIPKKLNLGASIANGEMLLILNDDIEILTPSWIERMLEHFEKPHVGVVGAKLLYPDKRTQHVGVVHNSGNPDHVRRLYPRGESGYFFSTCGVRNYSAVTGACMMTPASIYREVGGYSDELAVSYNDADYCLKVRQKGFTVVYAPAAELIHMESQSRVAAVDPDATAWYQRRWASEIVSDQFYNERFLSVASPTFTPCINQRIL
jgi:glycosyltransferase involved in cell wall biosynthesis